MYGLATSVPLLYMLSVMHSSRALHHERIIHDLQCMLPSENLYHTGMSNAYLDCPAGLFDCCFKASCKSSKETVAEPRRAGFCCDA